MLGLGPSAKTRLPKLHILYIHQAGFPSPPPFSALSFLTTIAFRRSRFDAMDQLEYVRCFLDWPDILAAVQRKSGKWGWRWPGPWRRGRLRRGESEAGHRPGTPGCSCTGRSIARLRKRTKRSGTNQQWNENLLIQWGLENQTLNSKLIQNPNVFKIGIGMVQFWNGWDYSYRNLTF